MEGLMFPQKSHRKNITIPANSEKLAELLGIIFGDGGINNDWQLVISLNSIKDIEFSCYVSELLKELFSIEVAKRKRPNQNTLVLVASSMNLLDFLISKGAVKGNKIAQNINIPSWISSNGCYERAFVRGLVDTDGGLYIHKHFVNKKLYNNLGFCFANWSKGLIITVSYILDKNGIKSYIKNEGRYIYLYSSKAIEDYLRIFGSNNSRIINKYNQWKGARVV